MFRHKRPLVSRGDPSSSCPLARADDAFISLRAAATNQMRKVSLRFISRSYVYIQETPFSSAHGRDTHAFDHRCRSRVAIFRFGVRSASRAHARRRGRRWPPEGGGGARVKQPSGEGGVATLLWAVLARAREESGFHRARAPARSVGSNPVPKEHRHFSDKIG